MCPPTYFDVTYAINPWMDTSEPVDRERALQQWSTLRQTYLDLGHAVELLEPVPGLPDMVFAANGALTIDDVALIAQYAYPQRADEAPVHAAHHERAGREVVRAKASFEAEGDLAVAGDVLLAGTGFRTDREAHRQVQEVFKRPVISLELVDPAFYHLDTCLFVLDDGRDPHGPARGRAQVAYYPDAFAPGSRGALERLFPHAVLADRQDALAFGLNSVSDGRHVVVAEGATGLIAALRDRGYEVLPVAVDELMKAGGGPKCCTQEIHGSATRAGDDERPAVDVDRGPSAPARTGR